VSDRIVVLDRGRVAGEFPTSRYSLDELMEIMREVASTGTFTEAERYRPEIRDTEPVPQPEPEATA
jgi:ABC-type sugar transport system ATPase subunit